MMLTTREMEVPTLLLIIVQTVAELQSTSTMSPLFGTSTNCTKMVNGDYNCYDDQRYKWLQCCLHKYDVMLTDNKAADLVDQALTVNLSQDTPLVVIPTSRPLNKYNFR